MNKILAVILTQFIVVGAIVLVLIAFAVVLGLMAIALIIGPLLGIAVGVIIIIMEIVVVIWETLTGR